MCTAISFNSTDHYFGRTLDYDYGFDTKVVITPRNYPFVFGGNVTVKTHYAIIGAAVVEDDYPLYFDAANEKGLCMAGLNFVGNAVYKKNVTGKDNIAQFELLPWLLSTCSSVKEARKKLEKINITDTPFREDLSAAPLHWMLADNTDCITVECVKEGMRIYENRVGVLTNNPPFDIQLFLLNNFFMLTPRQPKSKRWGKARLDVYSRGMGAMGLPGDFSSASRFVRAAFIRNNLSVDNKDCTGAFFKMLDSVWVPCGCCVSENGLAQETYYSCCINPSKGIYSYTTNSCRQINSVDMSREELEKEKIIVYPFERNEKINHQN
ncbi:MAG: choloylglycine hydrolase [Clostridia bacterium]|nr:choloylglycine hydrolase [Clostridia bacterium]